VLEEVVKCPFVSGAHEFLNRFAHILPCYVASATPTDELTEILRRRGMASYFREVFGAPTSKSTAVATILNETGLSAEEVAFVGDAVSDYEAAVANGVHFIARCSRGNTIFDTVECLKLIDLTGLHAVLAAL